MQHGETVLSVANLAFEGTPIAAKVRAQRSAALHFTAWHGTVLHCKVNKLLYFEQ